MFYNLDLFGKEICSLRNSLGLTQKDVSIATGINIDTLRKIENGKVVPKQETLDLLSIVLKKDLNEVLLRHRLNNYSEYYELKNQIENKIESGNYQDLHILLKKLKNFISKNKNPYFNEFLKQLYLLVESIILSNQHNDYENSLSKLIESMKITIPSFSLSNYNEFAYSSMEVRILMNIALLLSKLESKNKCLEVLLFCLNALEPDDTDLKIKICYNISYTYHRLDLNNEALYYSSLGIETCVQNNTLSCLGLLHYRKGIAEYQLGKDNYMDSLLKAISLFELSNQHNLKNMLINSCEKFYNIKIK